MRTEIKKLIINTIFAHPRQPPSYACILAMVSMHGCQSECIFQSLVLIIALSCFQEYQYKSTRSIS